MRACAHLQSRRGLGLDRAYSPPVAKGGYSQQGPPAYQSAPQGYQTAQPGYQTQTSATVRNLRRSTVVLEVSVPSEPFTHSPSSLTVLQTVSTSSVVVVHQRPPVNHALHCLITFFFFPWGMSCCGCLIFLSAWARLDQYDDVCPARLICATCPVFFQCLFGFSSASLRASSSHRKSGNVLRKSAGR